MNTRGYGQEIDDAMNRADGVSGCRLIIAKDKVGLRVRVADGGGDYWMYSGDVDIFAKALKDLSDAMYEYDNHE